MHGHTANQLVLSLAVRVWDLPATHLDRPWSWDSEKVENREETHRRSTEPKALVGSYHQLIVR